VQNVTGRQAEVLRDLGETAIAAIDGKLEAPR